VSGETARLVLLEIELMFYFYVQIIPAPCPSGNLRKPEFHLRKGAGFCPLKPGAVRKNIGGYIGSKITV
jgi:hypothetical protein